MGRLPSSRLSAQKAAACVRTAKVGDPFALTPERRAFTVDSGTFHLKHFTSQQIDADTIEWAVQLIAKNCAHMYERVWGWQDEQKREHLQQEDGCHIVVYSSQAGNARRVAYCHYRWEEDPLEADRKQGAEVHPVGYVYELQLEGAVQGCGLGTFLMDTVAAWGRAHGIHKLMLTCFDSNTAALGLYRHLGYSKDPSSPDPAVDGPELSGYQILSKTL